MELKYPGSLHNHDEISNLRLRDSIIKVEDLIDRAVELNHEVLAITEHDTIASAIRAEKHYKKVKEKNPNFKLILGNEIYLVRNGMNASNYVKGNDRYYHFILLAKDGIGHEQIREISTRAWTRSYVAQKTRRTPTYYNDLFEIISKNKGHVIGSTACLGGALATQLLRFRDTGDATLYEKIKQWCMQLRDIFGEGDFYLEMQPSHNEDQLYVNNMILLLSKELGIPFIITNDTHYLKKEDIKIHHAFLTAQNGERETELFYATTYLMTDEEIREYMSERIGESNVEKAYLNILEIKNKCEDFTLLKPLKIPRLKWANVSVDREELSRYGDLMPYMRTFLDSSYEVDRHLAYALIDRIKGDETLENKETYDEVNACLEATWISSEVNNARWSAYYLNLQNIIDYCWEAETLVGPGRGSGVGFIILYLLGITQINPLREKTKTHRWRFLNPSRVSVLDVDIDIESGRRQKVLDKFREIYGADRVANVLTFKTEKSKQAILTAARGLGIDVDIAQYLSSMIEADREETRTLRQTAYGDKDNDFSPNKKFRKEMEENYPDLWEVALKIEGLVCGMGVHAGGVIFVDEPFYKTTALMKSPKGEIITQFDLHAAEDVGLIKYDILSIEALDKIHICLDLLSEYGYIEKKDTLKETYESIVGIYNLEREEEKMWEMAWNHEVLSIFQMSKQSGIQGIELTKPKSVDDLATLNSVIRLMATEKGAEQPLDKYARFKENPHLWYEEMNKYGLDKHEQELLEPVVGISYGICEAQERFMQLVQIPECGGFDLNFADKLRKSIAKKNPKEYENLTNYYFEETKRKGCSEPLCRYVWNVLIAMSRGYGFNLSHTLAYSLVALQEINLAYRFPSLIWSCACLIADSGGVEEEKEVVEVEYEEVEEYSYDLDMDFEGDDEDEEDEEVVKIKKPKKVKTTNYGKIASAIGKISSEGVQIVPPNLNLSSFTFSPDLKTETIRYGLNGMAGIGQQVVEQLIENRPYSDVDDLVTKVKMKKPQVITLIKSGALDGLGPSREKIMEEYVEKISSPKKVLTLSNMRLLNEYGLIPDDLNLVNRIWHFNKYLKQFKDGSLYLIDETAFVFFSANFDIDDTVIPDAEGYEFAIPQDKWDKIYQKAMNPMRDYLKENKEVLLKKINRRLFEEIWEKYASGNISKWEMDSVSCYFHDHELSKVKEEIYHVKNFFSLEEEPVVDEVIKIKDKESGRLKDIPLLKITRIMGTVLDRNKAKGLITLLTKTGVVTVKIYGPVFANYDKRISKRDPVTGKKKVIEKSWFTRGNKIIVTGVRRGNTFLGKKYKKTPYHLVQLITKVKDNGELELRSERVEINE